MGSGSFKVLFLAGAVLTWACGSSRSYDSGAGGDDDGSKGGAAGSSKNEKGGAGGGGSAAASGGAGAKSTPGDQKAGGSGSSAGGSAKVGGGTGKGGAAGTNGAGGTTVGSGGKADGGVAGTVTSSLGGSKPNGDAAGTGGAGTGKDGSTTGTGAVTVELDKTHQTIEGFGINDTWGSQFSSSQADELFTTTGGIGLSILRVGMNSSGSFYNSFESSNISAATTRGAKVIGSVWTPPGNCKDNGKTTDGGHLLTSCYNSWATSITSFAKTNKLYAMSIANEPDFASCGKDEPCNGNYDTTLYTAKEMVAFVKVAGPMLQAAGVKVIAPEASEWIHFWSNISATGSEPSKKNSSDPLKCGCFGTSTNCSSACTSGDGYDYGHWLAKDADAWKAIDIIGVHEYDTQHAEPWPDDVTAERKQVWQTEMSGVKWWPEQGPSSDIDNGVAVAGWIHSALVVGDASAWLWWWYSQTGDNEGLMLGSTDTKRHYTLGNYSKFVRPGSVRVDVTGAVPSDVLLSAYKGSDGGVVIVAINKGSAAVDVPISISGATAPASMIPNVTSASDNLVAKTAVTVSGGTFTASLASKTVTTFVGK